MSPIIMKDPSKLKVSTPSDRELTLSREFDAPAALVWRTYTEPALLKRWLGVHNGHVMTVCEIDLRVGGTYRYEWKLSHGPVMGMSGVYVEITPHERIVASETFDDPWHPGEATNTVTLTQRGGKTTLALTTTFDSKATRDAVLASPMKDGVGVGFEALEAILADLR